MREFIRKTGPTKTVLLLTLLSLALALVATVVVITLLAGLGVGVNLRAGLLISVFVTLCIAPLMAWFVISMYFKVDQLEAQMRQLANFDPLTGFLRRTEFFSQVTYFHSIALRERLAYTIILVDLDNYKQINDQYGHQAGDRVLEILGISIRQSLRESDLVCRYGGDEFIFFLPHTRQAQAETFALRLHSIIQEPIPLGSTEFVLTASMGVACFPDVLATDMDEFILAADQALYKAKEKGGNQTRVFPAEDTLVEQPV